MLSEPRTTDYCLQCGESPESGSHLFNHKYVDSREGEIVDEAIPKPWVGKKTGWPHWTTPTDELLMVAEIAPIGLDPCANYASHVHEVSPGVNEWILQPPQVKWAGVKRRIVEGADGLNRPWEVEKGKLVFVNPPYGRELKPWTEKLCQEGNRGIHIFALLPAKTDTLWFHGLIKSCHYGCFRKGRISFDNPPPGAKDPAPPGATFYAYWGPRGKKFVDVYKSIGEVMECECEEQDESSIA